MFLFSCVCEVLYIFTSYKFYTYQPTDTNEDIKNCFQKKKLKKIRIVFSIFLKITSPSTKNNLSSLENSSTMWSVRTYFVEVQFLT